jgi:hypothetical protein
MTIHPETSCSQCGGSFGPGKDGFSHCDQHAFASVKTEILKASRLRAIKLHRQLLDDDAIESAFATERGINAMDAELARRGEYLAAIKGAA